MSLARVKLKLMSFSEEKLSFVFIIDFIFSCFILQPLGQFQTYLAKSTDIFHRRGFYKEQGPLYDEIIAEHDLYILFSIRPLVEFKQTGCHKIPFGERNSILLNGHTIGNCCSDERCEYKTKPALVLMANLVHLAYSF